MTPDAHPIYGATPINGMSICAGFSGHGFMHGPVSGKLMSEFILDGKFSTLDVSMLDFNRFAEGRAVVPFESVHAATGQAVHAGEDSPHLFVAEATSPRRAIGPFHAVLHLLALLVRLLGLSARGKERLPCSPKLVSSTWT